MEADYPGLDVNLEILGFSAADQTEEAEMARTWILATMDEDEDWFERRSMETIRAAYRNWRLELSLAEQKGFWS